MGIIHHNEVNRNSILEAARQYHNRGWSVIPISPQDKKPARGWKQYQKQRPCEKELSDWFGEGSPYNLGIVCGAVSGRLAVMDFDARGAYTKWKDKHRALAKECPTAKTGRPSGRHVYFRMPEGLDLARIIH